MSAAKTKAQAIIDENPVGMSCSLHPLYERQTDNFAKPSSQSRTVRIAERQRPSSPTWARSTMPLNSIKLVSAANAYWWL
jgi:hypothetical protein